MPKRNELWRKGRLYEGEDCLLMKWQEGKVTMGIVYHLKTNKTIIMRDEQVTDLKDLTKLEREGHDDALDYLISIAHDRPYHVLMS